MVQADHDLIVREQLYVGGRWVAPQASGRIELTNPATGKLLGRSAAAGRADVDIAVGAARSAFPAWADTAPADRAALLRRIEAGLTARMPEVGSLVSSQVGMPLSTAVLLQGGAPAYVAGAYAAICEQYEFETVEGHSRLLRRPIGVVAAITPWNWPLYIAVCKVAAALAAGCTVVVKPSEVAPLTELLLADVAAEAGVPAGVINVVPGWGDEAGAALVAHAGVDKVSFTGSTANGVEVAGLAGRHLKPTVMELGGKSASVVLDDADLEEAVQATVRQCYLNAGQTCLAWSRLLVPRHLHDDAAQLAAKVADGLVVGDPFDPATDIGPLASPGLRQQVERLVQIAVEEGAILQNAGPTRPPGPGWYVRPTVLAGVTPDMTVAREEAFGPVLCVMPYDGGDDGAVAMANDSEYGLHGAVFSADRARALTVARRLRTGQVDVCGAGYNVRAPIGGFGRSGWGRELGVAGMEEFLATTSIQLP